MTDLIQEPSKKAVEEKASAVTSTGAATIKMYAIKPIYDQMTKIDHAKVSSMYAMKSIYADQEDLQVHVPARSNGAEETKAKKPKAEKAPKPAAATAPPAAEGRCFTSI
jgi:hypothetical protein